MDHNDDKTTILSLRTLLRAEMIDGRDTIVLHMQSADAKPVALMMPHQAAQQICTAIDAELVVPVQRDSPDVDV